MSSSRLLDILVFGATGFTGKEVVRYMHSIGNKSSEQLQWGIGGRSQGKLNKLKEEFGMTAGSNDVPVLVADTTNPETLIDAFRQTKLVLNCTGPFRFHGEAVVKACIESGAHYMDICGEPQFMEDMFLRYHELAQSAGVLILHACAFDSVPADFGFLFAMRQFAEPEHCHSVESFLSISCGDAGFAAHYTTYECAVHGMGDVESLRGIRKEVEKKFSPPKITNGGNKLEKVSSVAYDERVGQYIIPFMGADASVVRSTARSRALAKRKDGCLSSNELIWPQYGAYVCLGTSLASVGMVSLYGGMISLLSGFEYGRSVLLAHPEFFTAGVFSHSGPTREQLDTTGFRMRFISKGLLQDSNGEMMETVIRTSVEGPEPGYVATPVIFLVLAKVLLNDTQSSSGGHMPKGGVYTPGAAFYSSEVVFDKLNEAGIVFKREE